MPDDPENADDIFLAELGFKPSDFTSPEHKARVLASLVPKRAILERMIGLGRVLALYEQGLGPRPEGMLLD